MPNGVQQQKAIRESAISWCEAMVAQLNDLLGKLAAKRAGTKAPDGTVEASVGSLPLPYEESGPFGQAIAALLDVIYHLRKSPPKKEHVRSELLRIKDQLIPEMEERLKWDTEFRELLWGIKRQCNQAIRTVEALVPSLLVEDAERGLGQSAVRKAVEALRLAKSRLSLWEANRRVGKGVSLAKQRIERQHSLEWFDWKALHRVDWDKAERRKDDFIWDEIRLTLENIGVEVRRPEEEGEIIHETVMPRGGAVWYLRGAAVGFEEEMEELADCLRHLMGEVEDRSSVRACVEALRECAEVVNKVKDRIFMHASDSVRWAFTKIYNAIQRLMRRAEEWLLENAALKE